MTRRYHSVERALFDDGFYQLYRDEHSSTFYRWRGKFREEVVLSFDTAGRLVAWSVWHNERVREWLLGGEGT